MENDSPLFSMYHESTQHSHDDYDLVEYRHSIASHCKSSKLPFGCWKGRPSQVPRLAKILKSLRTDLSNLATWHTRIVELGPNGGRWTIEVIDTCKQEGWARSTDYYLVGSSIEFELTKRDAIVPSFDKHFQYNKVERIPSGPSYHTTGHLITDLRFHTVPSEFLYAVNQNNAPFIPRIDMFLAFDSIRFLPIPKLIHCVETIRHCIVPSGGRFYCNMSIGKAVEFERKLEASGFVHCIDPFVHTDNTVYYVLLST